MAVNDAVFSTAALDACLTVISGSDELYMGSGAIPTTRAEAISGAAHAAAIVPGFQAITTGTPSGRELGVDTKDMTANAGVTLAWIALCTLSGTTLNYVQELAATQAVTSSEVWTMPAFTITLPNYDAA